MCGCAAPGGAGERLVDSTWGRVAGVMLAAAATAGVLLWVSTWDGHTFGVMRVGSAGDWFAGIPGAAVLGWAVGEPARERSHDANRGANERVLVASIRPQAPSTASQCLPFDRRGGPSVVTVRRSSTRTICRASSSPSAAGRSTGQPAQLPS